MLTLFLFFFFIKEFQSDTVTVNLVAADPPDACYSVVNGEALQKSIALVERGLVLNYSVHISQNDCYILLQILHFLCSSFLHTFTPKPPIIASVKP